MARRDASKAVGSHDELLDTFVGGWRLTVGLLGEREPSEAMPPFVLRVAIFSLSEMRVDEFV